MIGSNICKVIKSCQPVGFFIIIIEILTEPAQSPLVAFTTEFSANDLIPWLMVALLSFFSQVVEDVIDSSWSSAK